MSSADNRHSLLPVQEIVGIDRQIERYNAAQVVRHVPTQETANLLKNQEHPYENAQVTTVIINPQEPPLPIKFSATYVLEPGLRKIEQLDNFLEERTGKTIAQTGDLTIVRDPFGQEQCRVAPIILERWTDENGESFLMVADGNTRLYHYLSKTPPEAFSALIVDGINEKYRPVFKPVDIEDVVVTNTAPPLEKKRRMPELYNPSTYQNNRPDFAIFGSQGPRSTAEEIINNAAIRPIVDQERSPKDGLNQKIRRGFQGYAPPPHELVTATSVLDGVPEILDFDGITHVSQTLGMANFVVDYGTGESHNFRLLVKSREAYEQTATRGTVVLSPEQANSFLGSTTRPAGEFVISEEMVSSINQDILGNDIDIPPQHFASTGSENAPRVVGAQIDVQNSRFYTTIVLNLSDGHDVTVVLNRPRKDDRGRLNFGTVTTVRDQDGDTLLGYRFREGIGAGELEAFRMYSHDRAKLIKDFGVKVADTLIPQSSVQIHGGGSIDNTPTTFDSYLTTAPKSVVHEIPEAVRAFVGVAESSPPGRLTPEEVHRFITEGKISDAITVTALTIDQLRHGEIQLNPQFQESFVLMEEIFDPIEGQKLVMPRLPIQLCDRFTAINVDMGKTLDIEFPSKELSISEFSSRKNDMRLVPVPVRDIAQMVQDGKIDYVSLAHMSIQLRRSSIWKYSPPSESK